MKLIFACFMVELSECYLYKIECKAVMKALNYNIAPKTFRHFEDNTTHVFARGHTQISFSSIKYTVEFEGHRHSLNFLDIYITNNTTNKKYKFKIDRKDAIKSIHIKPNLCIDPSITKKSVFRGFLHRAHTICSEKYIKENMHFLADIFFENGQKRTFLENLVKRYNTKK